MPRNCLVGNGDQNIFPDPDYTQLPEDQENSENVCNLTGVYM